MRVVLVFCLVVLLVQCTKQRRLKNLEGNWNLVKILRVDGAFDTTVSEAYSFTHENSDGGNYELINTDKDSVLQGHFKLKKMGSKLILYKNNSDAVYRQFVIEDMDKSSLVMNLERDVYFLEQ